MYIGVKTEKKIWNSLLIFFVFLGLENILDTKIQVKNVKLHTLVKTLETLSDLSNLATRRYTWKSIEINIQYKYKIKLFFYYIYKNCKLYAWLLSL